MGNKNIIQKDIESVDVFIKNIGKWYVNAILGSIPIVYRFTLAFFLSAFFTRGIQINEVYIWIFPLKLIGIAYIIYFAMFMFHKTYWLKEEQRFKSQTTP